MEYEDIKFPETVADMMLLLTQVYPNKTPLMSDNTNKIMYEAGQRSVVDWLIELQNSEKE
jgi:hypothetical protein|tara:strand:- start:12100 stop:12279 length:180 start_codon:yes stop_codon:yes gene_type:complete